MKLCGYHLRRQETEQEGQFGARGEDGEGFWIKDVEQGSLKTNSSMQATRSLAKNCQNQLFRTLEINQMFARTQTAFIQEK